MGKGIRTAQQASVAAGSSISERERYEAAAAAAETAATAADAALSAHSQAWSGIIRRAQQTKEDLAVARRELSECQAREARSQTLYSPPRNGKRSLAALLADLPTELRDVLLKQLVLHSSRSQRLYVAPPLPSWRAQKQLNDALPECLGDLAAEFHAGKLLQIEYRLASSGNHTKTSPEKTMVELDEDGLPVSPYFSAGDHLFISSLLSCLTPALSRMVVSSVISGTRALYQYVAFQPGTPASVTKLLANETTLAQLPALVAAGNCMVAYVIGHARHGDMSLEPELEFRIANGFVMPKG